MMAVPVGATHAAVVVIEFADDDPPEERIVHMGSQEACDEVARSLPGVSYSGDRQPRNAFVGVYPLEDVVKEACEEGHPRCHVCGRRATCVGVYEDPEGPRQYSCDTCCAHGNEDGWCEPLPGEEGG